MYVQHVHVHVHAKNIYFAIILLGLLGVAKKFAKINAC